MIRPDATPSPSQEAQAAIIEQKQDEFPTMQSQAKRRALTDITDLAPVPGSFGVPGFETALSR